MSRKSDILIEVASQFEMRGFHFFRRRNTYTGGVTYNGDIEGIEVSLELSRRDATVEVYLDGRHKFTIHQDTIGSSISSIINECTNMLFV